MLSKLKHLVKYADFFYSSEMLRHQDEQQYRTLTGGILSIAIIITTVIGFASMILNTLDLSTISTSTEVVKNDDPTYSVFEASSDSNFMFAVEIWLVNTTGSVRYFDVTLSQVIMSGEQVINQTYFPLEPCTRNHWNSIPSLEAKFDKLAVNNWLCPPIGQAIELYGKYSSDMYSIYVLSVNSCNNNTDPDHPCAPQQEIDQLFTDFTSFDFTLYYTNPIINPGRKNYKSYYLQDENYVIFGDMVGSEAYVYFSDYTINTDYSIWPFQNIVADRGIIVQSLATNHPYQSVANGSYANIYLAKSSNSLTYTRQVQKISSVFSFIGGMISAVSALLFFIKIYTNLSYEISIALSIFQPEKDCTFNPNKLEMNFITFIKYYVYQLCQKIGFQMEWASVKYIIQCQKEIVKQLDIRSMVNRLIFIEHCLTHIFQDYQIDGLQMNTPTSPSEVRSIREKCECIIEGEVQAPEATGKIEKNIILHSQLQVSTASPQPFVFKHQKFKQNPLVVEDMISDNLSSQISVQEARKKTKRGTKNNIVFNDFNKNRIREANLYLLYANANKGHEMSKKIWHSLSAEVKEKVESIEPNCMKLASFEMESKVKQK